MHEYDPRPLWGWWERRRLNARQVWCAIRNASPWPYSKQVIGMQRIPPRRGAGVGSPTIYRSGPPVLEDLPLDEQVRLIVERLGVIEESAGTDRARIDKVEGRLRAQITAEVARLDATDVETASRVETCCSERSEPRSSACCSWPSAPC